MKFYAVLWKEWVVFRRTFFSTSLGMAVGPLLYLIAFGWGLGNTVQMEGTSYLAFVIPGIVAMNSMTNSFSPIAYDINLSRIYGQTFEATMTAPISMKVYTAARILAGALRGVYSACLILLLSLLFRADIYAGGYFWLMLVLNCLVFSSLGFIAGLVINSHADMAKVTNFIITPMSFLCGTFFSLDKFPGFLRLAVEILPLSQAVRGMRGGLRGSEAVLPPVILLIYLAVLGFAAVRLCRRAE